MTGRSVAVIGSGFGGSVAALRLVEKGYDVTVFEAGRRFADADFAKTSWDLSRFLWAPALGCFGIQRIHKLPDVLILAGAGVGGGSLVYANTLYVPKNDAFYNDPQWASITDWKSELAPYYDQASRMLGVVTNRCQGMAEDAMLAAARRMGCEDSYVHTPVGVYFGEGPDRSVDDPFFGGAGPRRQTCTECGSCMTGCRVGAKNTLVKNYLGLAEKAGATVVPLRQVSDLRPVDPADPAKGYLITTERPGAAGARRRPRTVFADQVVLAAGTWGTQSLLHKMKATGALAGLSDRLGYLTRTNSEALVGAALATAPAGDAPLTKGVAITTSFHPDEQTHVENCRYGVGSNAMGLLVTALADGDRHPRWLTAAKWIARNPGFSAKALIPYRWSERTLIGLVMQHLDNSLRVSGRWVGVGKAKTFMLTSRQGHGEPNPTWIPIGHRAMRVLAEELGRLAGGRAEPGGAVGDLINVPMTAHFLGGAPIGADAQSGVVDGYHRVYGYPGLHIVDGSTISANIGVNPSLTITAQCERAMSLWPNAGEQDQRPELGSRYRRMQPIAPRSPVVPASAPGALRLSLSVADGKLTV